MKPYDIYFNDEVTELLKGYSIYIINIEPITGNKAFEPSFRLSTPNHTYFAKFSILSRFSDSFLTELSELNRTNKSNLLLPIISENIGSLKRQLNIYEWLNGNNLKSVLYETSSKIITEYGYQCGGLLRNIHMKMEYPGDSFNNIIHLFDEYVNRLELASFAFVNHFDYRDYFYKNYNVLFYGNKHCFVHMDFKPKNLILYENKITVVDIDSCCVGNPWMDFYDKAFSLYPKKEIFNSALIRAYFNDNIPIEFWEFFKVLSVYTLIQNTAYLIWRKDKRYIRLLESYLWNSYNGFAESVPKWINKTNFY